MFPNSGFQFFIREQYTIGPSICWFIQMPHIDFDFCVNLNVLKILKSIRASPWHCVLHLQCFAQHDSSLSEQLTLQGGYATAFSASFFYFDLNWNSGPRQHTKLIMTENSATQTPCNQIMAYSHPVQLNCDEYVSWTYRDERCFLRESFEWCLESRDIDLDEEENS